MILLYTGAAAYNLPQPLPYLSIGGWISNSPVPNSMLNNLFSDLSYETIMSAKVETRGLILFNEQSSSATSVTIGYIYPASPKFTLGIAFTALGTSGTAAQQIERLPNSQASPYYAPPFVNANIIPGGANNSITLPNPLPANSGILMWLQRTAIAPIPPDFNTPQEWRAYDQEQLAYYQQVAKGQIDFASNVQLVINYNQ